tara:strand:+ start:567 stop:749 length:183 start_codon:yes stop_codon:yes gene_type:complete
MKKFFIYSFLMLKIRLVYNTVKVSNTLQYNVNSLNTLKKVAIINHYRNTWRMPISNYYLL